MSTYESLSRRGMIQLAHDYDKDNDDGLKNYLQAAEETGSHYEEVRPVEQIIDKADKVAEKLSDAGSNIAYNLLDRMSDKLTEFVDEMATSIADGTDLTEEV